MPPERSHHAPWKLALFENDLDAITLSQVLQGLDNMDTDLRNVYYKLLSHIRINNTLLDEYMRMHSGIYGGGIYGGGIHSVLHVQHDINCTQLALEQQHILSRLYATALDLQTPTQVSGDEQHSSQDHTPAHGRKLDPGPERVLQFSQDRLGSRDVPRTLVPVNVHSELSVPTAGLGGLSSENEYLNPVGTPRS